jgi:hypothetical protein
LFLRFELFGSKGAKPSPIPQKTMQGTIGNKALIFHEISHHEVGKRYPKNENLLSEPTSSEALPLNLDLDHKASILSQFS